MLSSDMGHVALLDWKEKNLLSEFHLKAKVNQSIFIHDQFLAVSQQDNVYIYDYQGLEAHQMSNIIEPLRMEFLRNHFALVSLTRRGRLFYTDVSTGQTKMELKTSLQEVI